MAKINREAGDKTKGFTLQKQRALALFFDEVKSNPNVHVNVAIEHKGDVFLQNEKSGYIEEQKNYNDSTSFSFNSHQILNTLAYFLEIWLSENKSKNIKFGFYSTNKITKESITDNVKKLGIKLPAKGILKLIVENNITDKDLLDIVRRYLVQEYNAQYKKDITSELDDTSLTSFLSSINWLFEQDNEKVYKQEVISKIKTSEYSKLLTNSFLPEFVYAALMLALEEKQDEVDTILKFLRKESVENIFLKVSSGQEINLKAHKYLNIDVSEFKSQTKIWLETYLQSKYFSNVNNKVFPELIKRKVARHNKEIKIERKNLEQKKVEKDKVLDVIIQDFGDLINDSKPTFLFGELGSGKSTLLAHYFLNEIENDVLPVYIPSSYLKGKVPLDTKAIKAVINDFVNEELNIADKGFNLDGLLATKKELTLIIDGVDEFDIDESKKILSILLNLSNSVANIRIVASGRPIELQGLVHFDQWNCLTTLDLNESEIELLLKNEAFASGLTGIDVEKDVTQRWEILKSKKELLSNATTPLTVCLIRDFLDENLNSKTLGDILYEVLKKRLDWHKNDQKENYSTFIKSYPHTLQREKFIAPIAYKLYISKDGKINEDTLFHTIDSDSIISNGIPGRSILVNESINFVKSNFLQKIGENYAFQSHQLHQLAVGLHIYNTISAGKDFQYKNARINSWREISYASAIARTKGESQSIEYYLGKVIEELVFSDDNTPAAAVLLAEAQISSLNLLFLQKVKSLGFRPLKYWGQTDSLVPHAYAYIINDLKEEGFNWFFNDYLNPKHPSTIGHDEITALVLRHYFVRLHFNLGGNEQKQLSSIIRFHLSAQTFSCHTLLPAISLVLPDHFEIRQRCILFAEALKENMLREKAEELLKNELNNGEKEAVINALEIVCRNTKDYQSQNAFKLWFELVDGVIPKLILDNCITLIGNGNHELFSLLKERIGDNNLLAYCRFSVLNQSPIVNTAAIVLYQFYGEKDFLLVGDTILKKSSWFDYTNAQIESILNELLSKGETENYILESIPNFDEKTEISEIYLKYFLASLSKSSKLYINEFLLIVRHLSKFSLTRYPEIRERFATVLSNKNYYHALKRSLNHLDAILRQSAASIILVCNPDSEKEALEIIIRSASKKLNDNEELLRLCMKLNYSKSMLDFIYELLNDLTNISRTFALKLLYHNNEYKLTEELLGELAKGLIGDGVFLDLSGNLLDDGVERVIGNEKLYNSVRMCLDSDEMNLKISAANNLLSYYSSKLNNKEKAHCWLLRVQRNEYALIDFHNRFETLFDDNNFVHELIRIAKEIEEKYGKKELLLLTYYNAIRTNGSWKDFFLALLKSGMPSDYHRLESLYGFIIKIGNSDPAIKEQMGKAIKELMSYPVYNQDHQYNYVIPQLAIFAHEFGVLADHEITQILAKYRISNEEVACALIFRLGKIPEDYHSARINSEHISLFATNRVAQVNAVTINDLNILIEDGEDIPNNLESAIESVILMGNITDEELLQISSKGNLGTYFFVVVGFSRNPKIILEKYVKAEDIGSSKYFARARALHYKSIWFRIRNILIRDDNWKKSYVESLVKGIDNKSSDPIDLFEELLAVEAVFDVKHLLVLYESMLQAPFRFNLDWVYWINEYVIGIDDEKSKDLIKPLKIILKAVNNSETKGKEGESHLLSWSLSLVLLFIEKNIDEDIERGFLTGLIKIFIQTNSYGYVGENKSRIHFIGRELIIKSNSLLKKIDSRLFQQLIQKGVDSNVPEISSVCSLFSVFTSKV